MRLKATSRRERSRFGAAEASKENVSTSTSAPIVIAGIDTGGNLYPIEKLEAHRRAALHLAISVFVFSGPRLLIQKRALSKYHSGGLWANSCCGHPNWGETVAECASRRLNEELGIALSLVEHDVLEYSADVGGGLSENERVHLFRGTTDHRLLEIALNSEEVAETRWIGLGALRAEMAEKPEAFTAWFRVYVERYPDLSFKSG